MNLALPKKLAVVSFDHTRFSHIHHLFFQGIRHLILLLPISSRKFKPQRLILARVSKILIFPEATCLVLSAGANFCQTFSDINITNQIQESIEDITEFNVTH